MTIMTEATETILKTDTKGRVKTPPERREKLLNEFERSGLSGAKFAELAGIKYQTFAAWVARRRKQRGLPQAPAKAANPVQWLEAVVQEAGAQSSNVATPLRVRLSTGAWIELNDLNQIGLAVALVRALDKPATSC
jgi:hypothetical protein